MARLSSRHPEHVQPERPARALAAPPPPPPPAVAETPTAPAEPPLSAEPQRAWPAILICAASIGLLFFMAFLDLIIGLFR